MLFDLSPPLGDGPLPPVDGAGAGTPSCCTTGPAHARRPGRRARSVAAAHARSLAAAGVLVAAACVVIVTGHGGHRRRARTAATSEAERLDRRRARRRPASTASAWCCSWSLTLVAVLPWPAGGDAAPAVRRPAATCCSVVLVAQAAVGYTQYFTGVPGAARRHPRRSGRVAGVDRRAAGRCSALHVRSAGSVAEPPATGRAAVRRRAAWRPLADARRRRPPRSTSPTATTDVDPDRPWIVIVWNDPINLMSYVTFVFQKLFGYSLEKADEADARRPPRRAGPSCRAAPGRRPSSTCSASTSTASGPRCSRTDVTPLFGRDRVRRRRPGRYVVSPATERRARAAGRRCVASSASSCWRDRRARRCAGCSRRPTPTTPSATPSTRCLTRDELLERRLAAARRGRAHARRRASSTRTQLAAWMGALNDAAARARHPARRRRGRCPSSTTTTPAPGVRASTSTSAGCWRRWSTPSAPTCRPPRSTPGAEAGVSPRWACPAAPRGDALGDRRPRSVLAGSVVRRLGERHHARRCSPRPGRCSGTAAVGAVERGTATAPSAGRRRRRRRRRRWRARDGRRLAHLVARPGCRQRTTRSCHGSR